MWRASLLYLILSLAATWPLVRHLDTHVAHDLGDPLLVTYLLNWNATVLPFTERWWHPGFFWPNTNVMALSEHVLGLSIFATPLRWLGVSALATYNLLFIASFWSAGLGGWVLGWTLTGRPVPALVSGLVFMFAPYRFSHLPHLQILASCAVPMMFAALHRASGVTRFGTAGADGTSGTDRQWTWVLMVVMCWLWQGLVSGYFLAFLPIGILLWLLWFAPRQWTLWWRLAAAGGAAVLLIAPLLLRYAAVHAAGGYTRGLGEVVELSADVAALWHVSDLLEIWGRVLPRGLGEEQLFPGLATILLVALSAGRLPRATGGMRRATLVCLGVAMVAAVVAIIALIAPGEFTLLGVHVSLTHPHKPLSFVWLGLAGAVLTSRTLAAARQRRSLTGGYLMLAMVTWMLTLGPAPTLFGERLWYMAPYSWLFLYVPGFDEFRVPARLFVMTIAAFAALAAIGAERLMRVRRVPGAAIVTVLAIAVVAEGWLGRMPLEPKPAPYALPPDIRVAIELPTGDAGRDAVAMYRSLFHGRPVANGWSGYSATSMAALMKIDGGDDELLREWAQHGPLAIILDPNTPAIERYQGLLSRSGATCAPAAELIVCRLDPVAGSQ